MFNLFVSVVVYIYLLAFVFTYLFQKTFLQPLS